MNVQSVQTFGRSALAALFLLLSLLSTPAFAGALFARETLTLQQQSGRSVDLNVELALTTAEREQGLMYRRSLGENEGMLFDFGESRVVYMWMKNTDLPLDMIFLDASGKVVHLHENAVPYSETIIPSVEPVRFVLEVMGGTVKRLGIHVGDSATSAQISRAR